MCWTSWVSNLMQDHTSTSQIAGDTSTGQPFPVTWRSLFAIRKHSRICQTVKLVESKPDDTDQRWKFRCPNYPSFRTKFCGKCFHFLKKIMFFWWSPTVTLAFFWSWFQTRHKMPHFKVANKFTAFDLYFDPHLFCSYCVSLIYM